MRHFIKTILRTSGILWLMVLAVGMASELDAADKAAVKGLRMADRSDFTRFVMDVPGLGNHQAFILDNPPRLVVDMRDTSWSVPKDELRRARSALVKEVRYGWPKPGILRIVLDLTASARAKKVFVVPPGKDSNVPRLVVDFEATGAVPRHEHAKEEHVRETTPPPVPDAKEVPLSMRYAQGEKTETAKTSPQVTEKKSTTFKSVPTPAGKPDNKAFKHADKPVVVIDPGHGGVDPGAIGRSKAREKETTFKYAVALKNELEKTGRYKVVLTRRGDYYVNLKKRVEVARAAGGDIFISLHADSHPDPSTRGLSIYTLSEKASDREAESLARRANREDVLDGVDLKGEPEDVKSLLIEMTQRDTKNMSSRFAEILVKEVGNEAKLLRNSHRFAGFVVLKGVDIPSVLVELGYLSNRHEERLLKTEAYKIKLVRSIVRALDKYFENR